MPAGISPPSCAPALEHRDPTCVVPGCEINDRLQIDHIVDFVKNGPTALHNLARLCVWHHYLKTHHRYRLSGKPGHWVFDPPDNLDHPAGHKPPDGAAADGSAVKRLVPAASAPGGEPPRHPRRSGRGSRPASGGPPLQLQWSGRYDPPHAGGP